MGLTDRTLLHDPSAPSCNVEPVVLFNIVDHYSRRDQGQDFVVGTLLGTEENGVVTVSSCFPVPHTEVEQQIALNSNFHTTMLALSSAYRQKVVGGIRPGGDQREHDALPRVLRAGRRAADPPAPRPRPRRAQDELCAFTARPDARRARVGTAFRDICCNVVSGESDSRGDRHTAQVTEHAEPVTAAAGKAGKAKAGAKPSAPAAAVGELESVEATVKKLLQTLEDVTEYVAKVTKGEMAADPAVVRLLQQLVASAPRLDTESFGKMFNTQVQDMLAIVYLANLTRTQLALAEKLQAVTLSSTKD